MRPPIIRAVLGDDVDEIDADNFCGGGGVSEGFRLALGRAPDIAVNHDPEAIAMHAANHPETRHYIESVWKVDPVKAAAGRRVRFAWFSPDCKEFSRAKGGTPKDQKIRCLAWVAARWAKAVQPRVILLENVPEFLHWGPMKNGRPIKERRGQTFRAFVKRLRALGYHDIEWRILVAADFGSPTKRKRLVFQARCDGKRIVWPQPTHGRGTPRRHIASGDFIDWSIPCSSIFGRKKPLADKTLARVARGLRKFVLEGEPYIVPNDNGMAAGWLVHRSNGERVGQAPRIYDPREPIGTIVAQGNKHAVCVAWLVKHFGDRPTGGFVGGSQLSMPIGTITANDHHGLATAELAPIGDARADQVAAFLVRYNGTGGAESLQLPLGTLTAKPRFGLVTVDINGATWVVVDIRLRMLTQRELFRLQGFREDYIINLPGPSGKLLSQKAQNRMVGNSVPPHLVDAIVRAAADERREERWAA